MNIFAEVKGFLTAKQVAESYGLQVKRNGMACCPFHNDKHPSMKIDKTYYCFACGVGGDVIDYVSRMYGLSQYKAALKLIEDFCLPITVKGTLELTNQEKERIRKEKAEQEKLVQIQERFNRWCNQSRERLKNSLVEIEQVSVFLSDKSSDMIFSEEYAQLLHAEPVIQYWLDILCTDSLMEKQELFMKGRKEVENVAERVRAGSKYILERNRTSA